ncbi:MAG: hypothetical protein ACFNUI_00365, partial [Negativicutes bacterium]
VLLAQQLADQTIAMGASGIELTVPVEYFDNTEYMEFNKAADGSLSITLKHITNLINRTS